MLLSSHSEARTRMKPVQKLLLVATCVVSISAGRAAEAQDGAARSFERLQSTVKSGATLQVTDITGHQITGKLAHLSSSSITLTVDGMRLELAKSEFKRVTGTHNRFPLGAIVGAASGAGAGLILATWECALEQSYCPGQSLYKGASHALAGAAFGAAIGAGVGFTKHTQRLVYAAPTKSRATVAVSPLLTSEQRGVAVSIRF